MPKIKSGRVRGWAKLGHLGELGKVGVAAEVEEVSGSNLEERDRPAEGAER